MSLEGLSGRCRAAIRECPLPSWLPQSLAGTVQAPKWVHVLQAFVMCRQLTAQIVLGFGVDLSGTPGDFVESGERRSVTLQLTRTGMAQIRLLIPPD